MSASPGKVSKAKANYRRGNNQQLCAVCSMFRAPDSCTAVAGTIGKNMLCDYFKRRHYGKR